MPYRLFILIILVFNGAITQGQNQFVQPGAEWHYDYYAFGGPWEPYVHFITYSGDTIIQNKNCQTLTIDQVEITPFGKSRSFLRTEYMYTSGDTVFYLMNGSFEILFNFSATVNDSWDLGVDTTGSNCSKSIVRVDSSFSVSINGQNLKFLRLSHDSTAVAYMEEAVERIGSFAYLFPQYGYCGPAVPEIPLYRLHCYHDDSFSLYDAGNFLGEPHNCFYEFLGIEDSEEKKIMIAPNPLSDMLFVNGVDELKYSIYDIFGKEVMTGQSNTSINVSELNHGLYILRLTIEDNGSKNIQFIKQ